LRGGSSAAAVPAPRVVLAPPLAVGASPLGDKLASVLLEEDRLQNEDKEAVIRDAALGGVAARTAGVGGAAADTGALPGTTRSDAPEFRLSDSTLLDVMGFLAAEEIARCMAVCWRWRRAAENETLWKRVCKRAIARFHPPAGPLGSAAAREAAAAAAATAAAKDRAAAAAARLAVSVEKDAGAAAGGGLSEAPPRTRGAGAGAGPAEADAEAEARAARLRGFAAAFIDPLAAAADPSEIRREGADGVASAAPRAGAGGPATEAERIPVAAPGTGADSTLAAPAAAAASGAGRSGAGRRGGRGGRGAAPATSGVSRRIRPGDVSAPGAAGTAAAGVSTAAAAPAGAVAEAAAAAPSDDISLSVARQRQLDAAAVRRAAAEAALLEYKTARAAAVQRFKDAAAALRSYRRAFRAVPAPRLCGFYSLRHSYIRSGIQDLFHQHAGILLVVFFRALRFYPDGSLHYVMVNGRLSDVVKQLRRCAGTTPAAPAAGSGSTNNIGYGRYELHGDVVKATVSLANVATHWTLGLSSSEPAGCMDRLAVLSAVMCDYGAPVESGQAIGSLEGEEFVFQQLAGFG